MSLKILFVGDVAGRAGRKVLEEKLPELKQHLKPDFTIVNGENAAGGNGITPAIARDFYEWGADAITLGNHSFRQQDIIPYFDQEKRIVRPANYPSKVPGRGFVLATNAKGQKLLVVNLMGRRNIANIDCPFQKMDEILKKYPLSSVDGIFVDFHMEATSEIQAFGHYLDGRVSAVLGTHTHVPTADGRVLDQGTAFQSDVGMTGNYNGVLGCDKEEPIQRFLTGWNQGRLEALTNNGTLCGAFVTLRKEASKKGLADSIEPVIQGPVLKNCLPEG